MRNLIEARYYPSRPGDGLTHSRSILEDRPAAPLPAAGACFLLNEAFFWLIWGLGSA